VPLSRSLRLYAAGWYTLADGDYTIRDLLDKIRQVCNRIKSRGFVLTKEIGVGWSRCYGKDGFEKFAYPEKYAKAASPDKIR
jgi:hypothetical protein